MRAISHNLHQSLHGSCELSEIIKYLLENNIVFKAGGVYSRHEIALFDHPQWI